MKTTLIVLLLSCGLGYYITHRPVKAKPVILLLEDRSLSLQQTKTAGLNKETFDRLTTLLSKLEGSLGFGIIGAGPEDIVQFSPRNSVYDNKDKRKRSNFEEAVLDRMKRPWTKRTDLHSALHRANAFFRPFAEGTRKSYLILLTDGVHDADRSKQPELAPHIEVLVVSPTQLKNFPNADQFESIGAAVDHIEEKEK